MESKPIFVIRFPYNDNKSKYQEWFKHVDNTLKEYNVLAIIESKTERVEFECYNVKDYNEIEFNELKEKLLKEINNGI